LKTRQVSPDGAGRAVRVMVVTPLGEGGKGGIDRIMDEIRHRLEKSPRPDLSVSFQVTRGQGHIALSPLLVAGLLLRLAGRPFGFGPDVQHINLSSHGSTLRKIAVARTARLFGIPYIIHLHGSEFRSYWQGASPGLSGLIRDMFKHASGILVLGRVWHDFILERVPEAGSRIEILPNATPMPTQPRSAAGDIVTILFLGEVGARKGVPQLIEALSCLPRELPWRAIIAGNGAIDEAKTALAGHGLSERVAVPGWVGPADVARLLSEADVLVLPSFGENLPMSVIEGMARGLAVVTTPVGAVEDIIESERTGLLVPPGDSQALAHALERVVGDGELRRRLGDAAQAFHREHLEIGGYVERLVTIWRDHARR
jgi:glycosyltransferase involved in cell wall biosynthesis